MSVRTVPIPQSAQISGEFLRVVILATLDVQPVPFIKVKSGFVAFPASHSEAQRIENCIFTIVSKLVVDDTATWSYFGKCGYFLAFPEEENRKLEDFYINHAKVYDPNYISHSQSFQVTYPKEGRVYFDKLGGFHMMIRKKKIIPIKRFAAYEYFYSKTIQSIWKWEDNSNGFKNYLPDQIYYLGIAFQKWELNKRLKVRLHSSQGHCYSIDFKSLTQKNSSTGFKRKIKQV
jgi:hypothetical protein